jgi:hypothetical protein
MIKKYFLFKDEVHEPVEQLVNISKPGEKVHQVCFCFVRNRETKNGFIQHYRTADGSQLLRCSHLYSSKNIEYA